VLGATALELVKVVARVQHEAREVRRFPEKKFGLSLDAGLRVWTAKARGTRAAAGTLRG